MSIQPTLSVIGRRKERFTNQLHKPHIAFSLTIMATSRSSSSSSSVPYFVLTLQNGNARAVFTVPTVNVKTLIAHPILCRGSSFQLVLDQAMSRDLTSVDDDETAEAEAVPSTTTTRTSFLCAEYYSPDPEETAHEISVRLAARISDASGSSDDPNTSSSHVAASFLRV